MKKPFRLRSPLQQYLFENPVLKHSVICRAIGWNQSSMSQWLDGERPIPDDIRDKMEDYLKQYGFKTQ